MPKRDGVYHKLWAKCAQCGFDHPRDMLVPQLGQLVCHDHGCFDDLTNLYRPLVIAAKLGDASEADDTLAQLTNQQDPGELEL